MDVIYLDYNATVPFPEFLNKEVVSALSLSSGNPSSLHSIGRKSRRLINKATEIIANYIDVEPEFIYWTSGASEGNSWVVHSAIKSAQLKGIQKPKLIISEIEHESLFMAAKFYQSQGECELLTIPVHSSGTVKVENIRSYLDNFKDIALLSVMYANNETGVIQPVDEISQICKLYNVPFHIDAVQALGKIPISVRKLGANYMTFSGHKVGALKGIGFVTTQGYGRILFPLIHGKQQKSLRGGTENPFSIHILGSVISNIADGGMLKLPNHLNSWRDNFEKNLKLLIPGTVIHGESMQRLPNTSYFGFEGIDGDGLLMSLDLEGICASSGSACTSGSLDPSQVLLAMKCGKELARSSLRLSAGYLTKEEDFSKVLLVLPEIIERVRSAKSL